VEAEKGEEEVKIPLAEHFHSPQGEGLWVGTLMHFLRLPGCSVGRSVPPSLAAPILPGGRQAWSCQTYDGRPFWCDTDFHHYLDSELDQLIDETFEDHLCVTGGEPLIHTEAIELFESMLPPNKILHVETSGTIPFMFHDNTWVTLSPKKGCLPQMAARANELKVLVDSTFSLDDVPMYILEHPLVYIQPVNYLTELNKDNIVRCLNVMKKMPKWRLSLQLHKTIGVR